MQVPLGSHLIKFFVECVTLEDITLEAMSTQETLVCGRMNRPCTPRAVASRIKPAQQSCSGGTVPMGQCMEGERCQLDMLCALESVEPQP